MPENGLTVDVLCRFCFEWGSRSSRMLTSWSSRIYCVYLHGFPCTWGMRYTLKCPWQVPDAQLVDDFKKADVQHFFYIFLNRGTLPSVHTEQKQRTLRIDSSASVIKTPWSWTTTEKVMHSVFITAIVLRSVFTTDVAFFISY